MYDNTNLGAIFKNQKTSDNQPDYKGKINVDGTDKEIALWLKTAKDGTTKYFSAKISDVYNKAAESTPVNIVIPSDDLPF